MTRDGFAFSTAFKVRYAEIDGQKVVFNSRYLEYTDVAATEFWEWAGIADALGATWTETEFHVRRASEALRLGRHDPRLGPHRPRRHDQHDAAL